MPKFSIITPVYNSFALMDKYFKSLEGQTFKDFEVIVVDDCSKDGSYEHLIKYSKNTQLDIRVLQTESNSGPGNARNIGIDASCGDWITFIDNDDWVDTDLLEKINSVIFSEDVHCVIYDYYIQHKDKTLPAKSMYRGSTGIVPISDCIICARNHTIGKFYKRVDCINAGVRFPHLRRCEDVAFVAQAIAACGSVYYLNEPMYYYWQRPNSLSNNTALDESDMVVAFQILEENLGSKYPHEIMEKSVPDLLYGSLLIMCKAKKPCKDIRNFIEIYEKKYPNWYECDVLNHLGFAKKFYLMCAKNKNILLLRFMAGVHSFFLK